MLSTYYQLHTWLDYAVVRDPEMVEEVDLRNASGHNVDFYPVFKKLNFRSVSSITTDASKYGPGNYVRLFLLCDDILYMLKSMKSSTGSHHATDGASDFLTWKEIRDLIFDDSSHKDLVCMITDSMTLTLKIIFDRFSEILPHDVNRKLPAEIWERILIHTLRGNDGGNNLGVRTLSLTSGGKKKELKILSKLVQSMANIHILLTRVLFLGRYIACGDEVVGLSGSNVVKSTDVRFHFEMRKRIAMRDLGQMMSHICYDAEKYIPRLISQNIIYVWKGCYTISTCSSPVDPVTVSFCKGVDPFVAVIGAENFWESHDFHHGTVTIYNMETDRVVIRIRVPIALVLMSCRNATFHLSTSDLVYVQPEDDEGKKAGLWHWRYDREGDNDCKFISDQRFVLPSHLQFPRRGFVEFTQIDGKDFIIICRHNVDNNASKILFINSQSGSVENSMVFPKKCIEVHGVKTRVMLLVDIFQKEVFLYNMDTEVFLWSKMFSSHWGPDVTAWGHFDADPDCSELLVVWPQDKHGMSYELLGYKEDDGCQPVTIGSGYMPWFMINMNPKSAVVMTSFLYVAHSRTTVSFCECGKKMAVICHDIVALSLKDGGLHPIESLHGSDIWVPVTGQSSCHNLNCKRYIVLNEANPSITLGFNTDVHRNIHFKSKQELLMETACSEEGRKNCHFVQIKFGK